MLFPFSLGHFLSASSSGSATSLIPLHHVLASVFFSPYTFSLGDSSYSHLSLLWMMVYRLMFPSFSLSSLETLSWPIAIITVHVQTCAPLCDPSYHIPHLGALISPSFLHLFLMNVFAPVAWLLGGVQEITQWPNGSLTGVPVRKYHGSYRTFIVPSCMQQCCPEGCPQALPFLPLCHYLY